MGRTGLCCVAAVLFIVILHNVSGLDLDSFLVDTLDSTILALERDRATKDLTKLVTVPSRKVTTYRTANKGK